MNFEIILCDVNEEVTDAFDRWFRHSFVSVEAVDLFEVSADVYVSPANSHGIMDGGLDRLLRARFPAVEASVQREIDALGGLLPVGEAIIVETQGADVPYLVCTPTMTSPRDIRGTRNVHAAMLAALRAVHSFNEENDAPISNVAIPGLGTGIGKVPPETAAKLMSEAFRDFLQELQPI